MSQPQRHSNIQIELLFDLYRAIQNHRKGQIFSWLRYPFIPGLSPACELMAANYYHPIMNSLFIREP